jgi:RNA polymerase-binding transcription factor DksA
VSWCWDTCLPEDDNHNFEPMSEPEKLSLQRAVRQRMMEVRNRRRQSVEEALIRLREGTYGIWAECEVEISEKH